ncbi:MAG: ribokinase [Pseudoxanthomonas suwonensis]|nr:ribokinase [Pseudoxanthomonas suwonensis]
MGRVVVTGSFNVDHVWHCQALPEPGATLAGRYASGPGGKGFNQAVAARRAGADTALVCALGDDDGGALARRLASADGIALHAHVATQPTGTAGIFVDAGGRNSIVIGAGANAALDVAHVQAKEGLIAAADVLLVQLESPSESIAAALGIARKAGVRTMLNPAPANASTDPELLALATVLTPNETEFAALLARHAGIGVDAAAVAGMDDTTLHALCRRLHPGGSVVLTLGAAGSFASHPEDSAMVFDDASFVRMAAEPARCIDSTGAGDAFNGALCAAWAAHPAQPFRQHLGFASRYAARATEAEGAAAAMPWMPA